MQGKDFDRVVKECDFGITLCRDYKPELLKPEAEKIAGEFANMKIKAEAKSKKTSALDLKEMIEKNMED